MPRPKIAIGNPGKPKGAVSKKTRIRAILDDLICKNADEVYRLLSEMLGNKNDFKWLMGIAVTLEPKSLQHSGEVNAGEGTRIIVIANESTGNKNETESSVRGGDAPSP